MSHHNYHHRHHHYRHRHHHYRHLDQSDLLAGVSYLNWFTCNPSRLLSGRLSKAPARRYFISAAPENISQRKVTKGKIFILMPPSTSIALCFICPTPLIANASDQTIIKMMRTSECHSVNGNGKKTALHWGIGEEWEQRLRTKQDSANQFGSRIKDGGGAACQVETNQMQYYDTIIWSSVIWYNAIGSWRRWWTWW